MKIVATGPSGAAADLDPLRQAGHEVIVGRPLDEPGRTAYTEAELCEASRGAHVILTSHPHNVSHSEAGRRANLKLALDQILAVGRGEPPAHVINPEAIPRWRRAP